ncbi:TonB-dependent receptor [bacterium]|nr:TonB-dependent receptor [bacterium]
MKQLLCFILCGIMAAINGVSDIKTYDLGEIVVYGHKKQDRPVVIINEISEEELINKGIQTVAEALELIPGADIQNTTKGEFSLNIRGFNQNELKILIDGVPAYEGYSGIVDLGAIPVESIKKIVITKGACSVLYGANTMGGVVNIITNKGMGKPSTALTASLGPFAQNYIVNHSAKRGGFNYHLGYSYRASDGIALSDDFNKEDPWIGESSEYREAGKTRELSDYIKQSFNANIGYVPDENLSTNLSFSWFGQERGCSIALNRYWRFADWNQWQISIAGKKRLNPIISVMGRLFYVEHQDKLIDDADLTVAAGGKSWFDRSKYDDFSAGGEFHSHLNLAEWNLMKIGVRYQKDRHRENEYNAKNKSGTILVPGWGDWDTYEADNYSVGMEDLIGIGNNFSIIAGGSYDLFIPLRSADMPCPGKVQILTPQVGAHYSISENTEIFGSIGQKIRFPRMKELYSEHAGGNPDLKAERTIASEIGIKQKSGIVNAYVSLFNNDISELIEQIKDSSGNWMYVNIGKSQICGLETEIDVRIFKGFNVNGNYTYLHAWNIEEDCELGQRPAHKINLGAVYDFSFGLSACLQAMYVGKQKVYFDRGADVRMTRDYTLANIRISQKLTIFEFGLSELFISVNNITDKNYEEGNGPMSGRSFLAGLKLIF